MPSGPTQFAVRLQSMVRPIRCPTCRRSATFYYLELRKGDTPARHAHIRRRKTHEFRQPRSSGVHANWGTVAPASRNRRISLFCLTTISTPRRACLYRNPARSHTRKSDCQRTSPRADLFDPTSGKNLRGVAGMCKIIAILTKNRNVSQLSKYRLT